MSTVKETFDLNSEVGQISKHSARLRALRRLLVSPPAGTSQQHALAVTVHHANLEDVDEMFDALVDRVASLNQLTFAAEELSRSIAVSASIESNVEFETNMTNLSNQFGSDIIAKSDYQRRIDHLEEVKRKMDALSELLAGSFVSPPPTREADGLPD